MDHPQLLSNCLPQAALALPFLVLQKPRKKVPETSSTIYLQALGWRSFLTLEFSKVWEHGNFFMTGSTIDLEILKYFFLASSGNLCLFLGSVLFSVNTQAEYSFNFFFLLLLAVNFLCHFFDPLFFMYLKMSYLFQCLI